MKNIYLIKDLSIVSGISIYTIKYYIKLGLIKECARSFGTNYRYFDDDAVETLKKIREYRRLNYPLKTIREKLKAA